MIELTVICSIYTCPYHDKNSPYSDLGYLGYCGRGVIKIDGQGVCSEIFHNVADRASKRKIYKNRTVFIDTEEMPETIEENRKEDAGSRPEDLIDGPAAYEQVAEKEIL